MKKLPVLLAAACFAAAAFGASDRTRLIILADMGNEPDEEQQMAHMLVNSNEFELEGLIAVTGKYLRPESSDPYRQKLHPELFHKLIDAYEKVYPNLQLHAKGWHTPAQLRAIVVSGQTFYGIAGVKPGAGTEGSRLIEAALEKSDPRPIWVVINAGSNTLAQALVDFREKHGAEKTRAAVAKLRCFENGSQDNAGAWITSRFPLIHWVRSNFQTYAFGGPGLPGTSATQQLGPYYWQPHAYTPEGQHAWTKEHVQTNHGALGEAYPDRVFPHNNRLGFLEGGGTVPWQGLVNRGLFDIDQPSWGGWGGRFTARKVADFWSRHADIRPDEEKVAPFYVHREASDVWTDPRDGKVWEGDFVPVWRWRAATFANLQCRFDWCVKPFNEANHHPVAAINGDTTDTIVRLRALPGEKLAFDASASTDPDGDKLTFSWWIYEEAGTYPGRVVVHGADTPKASLTLPTGARDHQIHLILEVIDQSRIAPLHDYRRIVIDVAAFEPRIEAPANSAAMPRLPAAPAAANPPHPGGGAKKP